MTSVPMASGSFPLRVVGCNHRDAGDRNGSESSDASIDSPQISHPRNGDSKKTIEVRALMRTDRYPGANGKAPVSTSNGSPTQYPDEPCDAPSEVDGQAGPYHRVREVRLQQGVSLRSMARRMGIDVKTYKRLEEPDSDLCLSELAAIQAALEVPFSDLLVDRQGLARPVEERAKMVKVMKTAVAIREAKSNPRIQRLAGMLCEQIVSIMPELADVSGWPQFGARRGKNALGRVLSQQIDMSQINDS